jgi:hypothetical protein
VIFLSRSICIIYTRWWSEWTLQKTVSIFHANLVLFGCILITSRNLKF